MKQKIKKLTRVVFIICIAMLLSNCSSNDAIESQSVAQKTKIQDAQNWLEKFASTKKIYSSFENQTYKWELAKVEKLENGLEAVTVPASNIYANEEYTGKRTLYLYPEADSKSFKTTIYDVITKRENSEDLDNFSGYIIAWNLETGFANGLKFENNKSLNSIIVEYYIKEDFKTDNSTGKQAPLPIIHLDEVEVGGGGGSKTSITVKDFSIGGAVNAGAGLSTGDYLGGGHQGGGGGGTGGVSSIKTQADLVALISSTDTNGYNITFNQNQNTVTSGIQINIVPWAGVQIFINQNKLSDKFIVDNVVSNMCGLTAGFSWSQNNYSLSTNGNTTTVTVYGTWTYNLYVEGVGAVYSSPVIYKITVDNKIGKITNGKRV